MWQTCSTVVLRRKMRPSLKSGGSVTKSRHWSFTKANWQLNEAYLLVSWCTLEWAPKTPRFFRSYSPSSVSYCSSPQLSAAVGPIFRPPLGKFDQSCCRHTDKAGRRDSSQWHQSIHRQCCLPETKFHNWKFLQNKNTVTQLNKINVQSMLTVFVQYHLNQFFTDMRECAHWVKWNATRFLFLFREMVLNRLIWCIQSYKKIYLEIYIRSPLI